VNQSATVELKAFLGLNWADELPTSPCEKMLASPYRTTPLLPPVQEEEQHSWPQDANTLAPLMLPECGMTAWWVPAAPDTKHVLQISDMVAGPAAQQWQWQSFASPYVFETTSGMQTGEEHNTTVILRNLPNNYTRTMLLDLLHSEGFGLAYDFVYIPIDFSTQAGLGYAFVNLVSASDALTFWAHFEGFQRWSVPSEKVCTLNWSAPIQGLASHVERYRNSPVMHEAMPDEWKPALFFGGERVIFPAPTKIIKAPKMRSAKVTDVHSGGY